MGESGRMALMAAEDTAKPREANKKGKESGR
jgi:hypothetical protein